MNKGMNEWGFIPPLCTYTVPGEHYEDGELIQMTQPSRHRVGNSRTLPLGRGGSVKYFILRKNQTNQAGGKSFI